MSRYARFPKLVGLGLIVLLLMPISASLAETECTRLFDRLDLIEQQGGEVAQSQELDDVRAMYQRLGCPGLPGDPGCRELGTKISRLRSAANLAREHQRVIADLRRNGCMAGEGARRAWDDAIEGSQNPDVLEKLYREGGKEENVWRTSPNDSQDDRDTTLTFENRSGGTYRTLCARTCDGYYWPISFSARPGRFEQDAEICRASCSNQEVVLLHHANPGQWSDEAVSKEGDPYAALANAFLYRKKYIAACACQSAEAADAEKLRQVQEQEGKKAVEAAKQRKAQQQPEKDRNTDVYRSVPVVVDPNLPEQEGEKSTSSNGLRGVSPAPLQEE